MLRAPGRQHVRTHGGAPARGKLKILRHAVEVASLLVRLLLAVPRAVPCGFCVKIASKEPTNVTALHTSAITVLTLILLDVQGWRCKTRMFSALHLPDEMEFLETRVLLRPIFHCEKMQKADFRCFCISVGQPTAALWCSYHPSCYGVQFYNAGMEENDGVKTEELVQDNLFYLLVKPPHGSYTMAQPLHGLPARFRRGERAFVFADDLQRSPEWMDNLEESSLLHVQRTWAEPNGVDVVLIIPAKDVAAKQGNGVKVHEVSWVRPELNAGFSTQRHPPLGRHVLVLGPRKPEKFGWMLCQFRVDRDFFKLHALGLEYKAIIFYDSDLYVNPTSFDPLSAVPLLRLEHAHVALSRWGGLANSEVFNCAYQDSLHVSCLFYNLFYRADAKFWLLFEEWRCSISCGSCDQKPLGVMLDGPLAEYEQADKEASQHANKLPVIGFTPRCIWLYENAIRVPGFPEVINPCLDLVSQNRCSEIVVYHKAGTSARDAPDRLQSDPTVGKDANDESNKDRSREVIQGRGCAASSELLGEAWTKLRQSEGFWTSGMPSAESKHDYGLTGKEDWFVQLRLHPSDANDSLYTFFTSPTMKPEL
ncbi:hypothetical protein AK812_SmicGene40274 [Symbiodinium microadriaticum]|uniref:Uncharacterized protein n=1 Tax=Symbiodinium microadriaticum TaxID=2951 RepID=A0A1Q9C970_SYMMI|nr:hypothetical protein AK812_SmicGene40274 [Symbiodinium microadriaticum]